MFTLDRCPPACRRPAGSQRGSWAVVILGGTVAGFVLKQRRRTWALALKWYQPRPASIGFRLETSRKIAGERSGQKATDARRGRSLGAPRAAADPHRSARWPFLGSHALAGGARLSLHGERGACDSAVSRRCVWLVGKSCENRCRDLRRRFEPVFPGSRVASAAVYRYRSPRNRGSSSSFERRRPHRACGPLVAGADEAHVTIVGATLDAAAGSVAAPSLPRQRAPLGWTRTTLRRRRLSRAPSSRLGL